MYNTGTINDKIWCYETIFPYITWFQLTNITLLFYMMSDNHKQLYINIFYTLVNFGFIYIIYIFIQGVFQGEARGLQN